MGCLALVIIQCATVTDDEVLKFCYNKHYSFLKKSKGGEGEEKNSKNICDLNPLPANPFGYSTEAVIRCATATHDGGVHCWNSFKCFLEKKMRGGWGKKNIRLILLI